MPALAIARSINFVGPQGIRRLGRLQRRNAQRLQRVIRYPVLLMMHRPDFSLRVMIPHRRVPRPQTRVRDPRVLCDALPFSRARALSMTEIAPTSKSPSDLVAFSKCLSEDVRATAIAAVIPPISGFDAKSRSQSADKSLGMMPTEWAAGS